VEETSGFLAEQASQYDGALRSVRMPKGSMIVLSFEVVCVIYISLRASSGRFYLGRGVHAWAEVKMPEPSPKIPE
jgi:hypothetical protein